MPFNDIGLASGLLCGFLFGYVLENAGFGSPCKLTAQFRMSDWSVFKVMFTAIVVAAVGLFLLRSVGLLAPDTMYVPPAFLGAVAIGGALIGAGFAVGGYCPGTSVVGLFSGRLDALLFSMGLVGGTWIFAGSFDVVERWTTAGESTAGDTLPIALGVPEWVVLAVMIAAAVMIFVIGGRIERHFNGPLDASAAMRD